MAQASQIWTQKLSAKEIPFLLTLLFAASGWSMTHLVDRVVSSPTIEYKTEVEYTKTQKNFVVTLTNLSRQYFKGLKFEITEIGADIRLIGKPGRENLAPAWTFTTDANPSITNKSVAYMVDQFHPDWRIKISIGFEGIGLPKFYLKETGNDQPVRLVESGLETFFAKNEACILFLLGFMWSGLAVIWLIKAPSNHALHT